LILTVLERLLLLRILPRQGNLTTLRIVRDLERELSFDEGEHAALQFVNIGDSVRWNNEADQGKDVEVGDVARELILKALREMDESETLTMDFLPLCDAFGYEGTDDAAE
jgi:hypothetical protein